jgi:hypothetical protein
MNKIRAQLDGLGGIAYALVGLAIMGGVGVLITAQFNSSTTNADAQAFLGQILTGYSTLGNFIPIVVIALVGLLLISFFQRR